MINKTNSKKDVMKKYLKTRVNDSMFEDLTKLAIATNCNISDIVRASITTYIYGGKRNGKNKEQHN